MKWTWVYHCPEGWSPYLIQDQILVNPIQRLSKSIQGYPSQSKSIQVIYESQSHESLSDQDQIWLRPKSTTHPINSQTLLLGNPIGFKTSYPIRVLDLKKDAHKRPISAQGSPQNAHRTHITPPVINPQVLQGTILDFITKYHTKIRGIPRMYPKITLKCPPNPHKTHHSPRDTCTHHRWLHSCMQVVA